MKYLTLALLLLSGCVRDLQVGECIIIRHKTKPAQALKVVEVGEYSVKFIDTIGTHFIITKEDLNTNGIDRLDCFNFFDKGGGK